MARKARRGRGRCKGNNNVLKEVELQGDMDASVVEIDEGRVEDVWEDDDVTTEEEDFELCFSSGKQSITECFSSGRWSRGDVKVKSEATLKPKFSYIDCKNIYNTAT